MHTLSKILIALVATTAAIRRADETNSEELADGEREQAEQATNADGETTWASMKAYNVSGMYTPTGVLVWYPNRPGTYPFVSFAHGLGDGGENLQRQVSGICSALANQGLIVAAHQSCNNGCFSNNPLSMLWARLFRTNLGDFPGFKYYYYEQSKVIDWAKRQQTFAPGIKADFSRGVGVVGHSMGGQAAGYSATTSGHRDVRASVMFHPYSKSPMTPNKPFLIVASSSDRIATFNMSQAIYNRGRASQKGLVNLPGKSHVAIRSSTSQYASLAAAWIKKQLNPYDPTAASTLASMKRQYNVQAQGW